MRFLIIATLIIALYNISYAQTLKVMTYNIRYDNPEDGINQWPKRIDKVVGIINNYKPDVIGIQEGMHHQLQDMMRQLPEYSYCGVGRDDGKEQGEYSAIIFRKGRFGLLEHKTFWLSETPNVPGSKSWDAAITRIATTGKLYDRDTKKEFLLINTHFDHIGKTARENSALLIREWVIKYKLKSENPVLVIGDFNSEPTEEAYLAIVSKDFSLLLDSRPKESDAGTFCGFKVGAQTCKTIDFIFLTKGWKVTTYKVINDNDGIYYPSDHLPVYVEAEFPLVK